MSLLQEQLSDRFSCSDAMYSLCMILILWLRLFHLVIG